MVNLNDFMGKGMTPSSRLGSALVSLVIVVSILFHLIPEEYFIYGLGFLLFHIANNFYVGLDEIKVPVCYKCGKMLKPKTIYPKHTCKK